VQGKQDKPASVAQIAREIAAALDRDWVSRQIKAI